MIAATNRPPLSAAVLDRTWSLPGYWEGVAYTRDELGDTTGATAARKIRAALLAGTPLQQINEFQSWRAGATR